MSRRIFGIILVLIGAVVILNRMVMDVYAVHVYWPLWFLIPGIALHALYFLNPRQSRSGFLMPAGILTVLGIVFFLQRLPMLHQLMLWPLILLAPAAGFLESYFFGRREWSMLAIGLLLVLIAAVVYVNLFLMLNGAVLLGIAFVVIGLYVVFRPVWTHRRDR